MKVSRKGLGLGALAMAGYTGLIVVLSLLESCYAKSVVYRPSWSNRI